MLALLAAEVAPQQEFPMVRCDQVFGCLAGRQVAWLAGRHASKVAAWQAGRQAGWVAGRQRKHALLSLNQKQGIAHGPARSATTIPICPADFRGGPVPSIMQKWTVS